MHYNNLLQRTRYIGRCFASWLLISTLLVSAAVVIAPEQAFASTAWLQPGQTLGPGQSISNGTGCFLIVQATDGNVVEYCNGSAVWSTHTYSPGDRLVMQTDGNLVLYTSGNSWIWKSGTNGYPGAQLALQDDQNLVVYSSGGTAIWATSWTQSASGAQAYAKLAMAQYGWGPSQWSYLYQVWQWESAGWQWNIGYGYCYYPNCNLNNAYGIPQSDPGTQMGNTSQNGGPDWQTNGLTQVQWGMLYILNTYTTPYKAYQQETSCSHAPPCGYIVTRPPGARPTYTVSPTNPSLLVRSS